MDVQRRSLAVSVMQIGKAKSTWEPRRRKVGNLGSVISITSNLTIFSGVC